MHRAASVDLGSPDTFGKKDSTWIGEHARHRERLAQLRKRVRQSASLKGPVGN